VSVNVILADDHALLREGLKVLLERAGIQVVGEAENGVELLEKTRSLWPQVVVGDASMPLMNGIEAAAVIRREMGIPTVLMTMHTDDNYVIHAMSSGVAGYLLKSQAGACLVEAIREVAGGHVYLSPGVSTAVRQRMLNQRKEEDPLTARERQVLKLLAEGHTTKEMAHAIGITVRTGESHRARIMQKLKLHNTAGLVKYALKRGLVDL
jgi:DNA-binding NarL/FixJ family response regulator